MNAPHDTHSLPPALVVLDGVLPRGAAWQGGALDWTLRRGDQWAVLGQTGSGKSALISVLQGTTPLAAGSRTYHHESGRCHTPFPDRSTVSRGQIVSASFGAQRQHLGKDPYAQARWDSLAREESVVAADILNARSIYAVSPYQVLGTNDVPEDFAVVRQRAVEDLAIGHLLQRRLVSLSNGERRRLMLARALCQSPRLVLLDDVFSGMDTSNRQHIEAALRRRAGAGATCVFFSSRTEDVPSWVSHWLMLTPTGPMTSSAPPPEGRPHGTDHAPARHWQRTCPASPATSAGRALVSIRNATVRYGDTVILDAVSWEMHEGEHWALTGPNGAGKTTLLSLITTENPQAYANDVTVLGSRRGDGTPIWQLREQIGHVSVEQHLACPPSHTCLSVVLSGLHSTVGVYRACSEAHLRHARNELEKMGLPGVDDRPFGSLSEGSQRLVLLARAMVKSPRLLILDEPCQGLDKACRQRVSAALERLMKRGCTQVIYVTHRLDELPPAITHMLELDAGRVRRCLRARLNPSPLNGFAEPPPEKWGEPIGGQLCSATEASMVVSESNDSGTPLQRRSEAHQ